ncbi:autotransporter outer membrane beta-barrel domain-containing protein [Salmonella enterica subsp. enterica serovar Newport]|nr:autotransporter outer membrane beta-barrel domain-containing protein [Salmonella enterica subsp. enterica serovar Newport]EJU0127736.1 autotransporter outer membrane beta-barrel domain-containing protein [Salmonella enterica subsp. enterica serovar Newport]
MAVEKKFKLNVIAASVLMGLSLSAVAAGDSQSGAGVVSAKEAPAAGTGKAKGAAVSSVVGFEPLIVGQKSEPVDAAKYAYKGSDTVSSLFDTDGAVGAFNKAREAAFGPKGALDAGALGVIAGYHKATADADKADADWDLFAGRADVIESEYKDALGKVYGAGKVGAYTDDLASATSLSTPATDGAFGKYVTGVNDFKVKLGTFQEALIGADGKGGALAASLGKADETATKLQTAVDKVQGYRNYLETWAKNEAAGVKVDAARNQIMATLPEMQHFITEWSGLSGNGKGDAKPDLAAKYQAFSEAVTALQSADDKKLSDARVKLKDAASALSTAFDSVKIIDKDTGAVSSIDADKKSAFQGLMTKVSNAVDAIAATDVDKAAWAKLEKSGKFSDLPGYGSLFYGSIDKIGDTQVASVQDALQGLQEAFATLCDADGEKCGSKSSANGAELKASWEALMGADGKGTDPKSLAFKYKTALDVLTAEKERLATVITEFNEKNLAYGDVRKAYFTAYDAYNDKKLDDAKAAFDGLKTAFSGLKAASSDVKAAISVAASGYASDRKDGVPDETALATSLGKLKTLIPVKLQLDSMILDYQQTMGQKTDVNGLSTLSQLQAAYQSANEARTAASDVYNKAVTAYKDASGAYDVAFKTGSGGNLSKAEADLTVAAKNLLLAAGYNQDVSSLSLNGGKNSPLITAVNQLQKLPVQGVRSGEFVAYEGINEGINNANFSPEALAEYESAKRDIETGAVSAGRRDIASGLRNLAELRVLYTDKQWSDLKIGADKDGKGGQSLSEVYLAALEHVGVKATSAEEQKKVENAETITHHLGWADVGGYDFTAGRYNPVILETDKDGKVTGIKRDFTAADLYTGTQDKPFTTTVLNIAAPVMGNGVPAEANTITVGEASTKDKKATPVEVWARTEKGAVKLSGDLKTAITVAGKDGAPEVIRGADRIILQNVNIHNSYLADKVLADKVNMLQTDMVNIGLHIDTRTVDSRLGRDMSGALSNMAASGTFGTDNVKVAPNDANILLDNVNITLVNDRDSRNTTHQNTRPHDNSVDYRGKESDAILLSGSGNHILASGGVFDAGSVNIYDRYHNNQANVLSIQGGNNIVDFAGSTLKGDIRSYATGNTVNLKKGSTLTGDVAAINHDYLSLNLDNSTWTGGAGPNSPDVSLSNNSVWNIKGYDFTDGEYDPRSSSVNSLTLNGSNTLNLVNAEGQAQLGGRGVVGSKYGTVLRVDHDLVSDGKGVTSVLAGTYSPGNAHRLTNIGLANDGYGGYRFGGINVDGLATGGKYALSVESSGAEPYTISGRLADDADATSAHEFVSYKTSENRPVTDKDGKPVTQNVKSDADFISLSAPAELGVYQYAAEKVMDAVNNRTNIYYSSTGKLSNSAATAVSMAAAPVDVANLQSDTLAKHMNSVRHGKDSGVWLSYFGGENRNTTAVGPEYKLKTNGVMLGVDTLTENDWLAGVAVSSARSDMSVMNSSGDLNSYGAQFYMSRRYDSGVFVDGALQFNHFSNTAKARMINGQQAKADFSGNSYGVEAKVGYAWNSEGFFAEPYVRAAARAFDGEHYALSNGMTVNSNDYRSMLGEVGADLGYQYDISGGYVKPYLHLAALNEFADGNSVRVNNVSLDNSVKGAAFQAGLGAEVKVTDNLGGYAAFDYTKGDNTERPWQATVGVNYTW